MGIKSFRPASGGDYSDALRRRRGAALGLLLVGVLGLALALPMGGNLSDPARSLYLGGSSGLIGAGAVLAVRTQYLLSHPQAQRKARIREKDERSQRIAAEAGQAAGAIVMLLCCAAAFLAVPFSRTAAAVLLAAAGCYWAAYLLASVWLGRRL